MFIWFIDQILHCFQFVKPNRSWDTKESLYKIIQFRRRGNKNPISSKIMFNNVNIIETYIEFVFLSRFESPLSKNHTGAVVYSEFWSTFSWFNVVLQFCIFSNISIESQNLNKKKKNIKFKPNLFFLAESKAKSIRSGF